VCAWEVARMRIGKSNNKCVQLPDDAATQTYAFLGRKGQGKTYAAGKLVELFLKQQTQVVILDPIGNWYGLRYDKSGKKPSGYDIPILGGLRGDIDLRPEAGEVIAGALTSTKRSAILDVSQFRKNERKRFVGDFAEELYRLQKAEPTLLHIVLEEAHVFAPQMSKGNEKMLGAIEDIVRLGRNCGIGVSMLSQRPQSINKEILNMAEPLVVFQLVAAHERKAIEEWMKHQGEDVAKALTDLARLQSGECFFWSPAWLNRFERMRFDAKKTYDASATIKPGDNRSVATMKPLDLEQLSGAMQEYVEEQQANDPKTLKRRIVELERQLKAGNATVEQSEIDGAVARATERVRVVYQSREQQFKAAVATLRERMTSAKAELETNHIPLPDDDPEIPVTTLQSSAAQQTRLETTPVRSRAINDGTINAYQKSLLAVVIDRSPVPTSRSQIGALSGKSIRSSAFGPNLRELENRGYVVNTDRGWVATELALHAMPDYQPAPQRGEDARRYWLQKLPAYESSLLQSICDTYPQQLTPEQLAEITGRSLSSSAFYPALRNLRELELIEGDIRQSVAAAEVLF